MVRTNLLHFDVLLFPVPAARRSSRRRLFANAAIAASRVGSDGCDDHHEMSDLGAAGEPVHGDGESATPVWPHQRLDGPFAALMERST